METSHDITDDSGLDLDMSEESGLTELEKNADAEAEASREDRGTDSESDAAALAEEVGAETSDPETPTEDELEEVDSAPEPPLRCGVVPGTQSNLGSRHQRQNRQRGR